MENDRDPSVWHLHPSRVVEVQERQLLRACVRLLVLLCTCSCLIVVVLSCRTVGHPHSSKDIARVVVRSRDGTYSIHGSISVKSAGSSTFSLCERSWPLVITILTIEQDQRLIYRFATFTRLARVARFTRVSGSENPRGPSHLLWATSSGTSNRACSQQEAR